MVGRPLKFSRAAVGPGVAALGLQMTTNSGAQAFSSSEASPSFRVILGPKLMILNSMSERSAISSRARSMTVEVAIFPSLTRPILNMPKNRIGSDKRILMDGNQPANG